MNILLLHLLLPIEKRVHSFMRSSRMASPGLFGIASERPCLSLLYLASGLKEDGHEVHYHDGVCLRPETYLDVFNELKPDVVGLTSYSVSWEMTKAAIGEMRQLNSRTIFIAGGAHAYTIGKNALIGENSPDVLFMGEAEESIREWAAVYDDADGWENVSGIYYRTDDNVVMTENRPPPADLDALPFPAWDMVDLSTYRPAPNDYRRLPHASFFGSRGCSYKCVFCPSSNQVRFRSTENMLQEINLLIQEKGVKDIIFWDETILLNRDRALRLFDGMIGRDLNLTWSANARVDQIDYDILKIMKKAGCWQLLYGIESGVQSTLDRLNKGFSVEQARSAVEAADRAGIKVLGMFIFGVPSETYEQALQTIDFASRLKLNHASFLYFTPYPGTQLYDRLSNGVEGEFAPDADFGMKAPSFIPATMSSKQLLSLQALAFKRFYLNPRQIINQIAGNLNRYKFTDGIRGFISLLFS